MRETDEGDIGYAPFGVLAAASAAIPLVGLVAGSVFLLLPGGRARGTALIALGAANFVGHVVWHRS